MQQANTPDSQQLFILRLEAPIVVKNPVALPHLVGMFWKLFGVALPTTIEEQLEASFLVARTLGELNESVASTISALGEHAESIPNYAAPSIDEFSSQAVQRCNYFMALNEAFINAQTSAVQPDAGKTEYLLVFEAPFSQDQLKAVFRPPVAPSIPEDDVSDAANALRRNIDHAQKLFAMVDECFLELESSVRAEAREAVSTNLTMLIISFLSNPKTYGRAIVTPEISIRSNPMALSFGGALEQNALAREFNGNDTTAPLKYILSLLGVSMTIADGTMQVDAPLHLPEFMSTVKFAIRNAVVEVRNQSDDEASSLIIQP